MPMFLENFGIEFFREDEETFDGLLGYLTQNGKAIKGYYGYPSLFNKQGDIDMYIKTIEEDGKLVVAGLDTHCTGPHVWTMAATSFNLTPKDALPTERLVAFQRADDRGGLVPIHLINADVLPSFRDGDIIKMQMTALPLEIKYYATEEEYAEDQLTGKDGKKWMTATGTFFSVQMLYNHRAEKTDDEEVDYSTDDIVLFTAKVKKVYHGNFTFGENTGHSFIRCVAETENGDIIFAHTAEQVEDRFRDNIQEGAIISGICVLSGDVAIYEYENGIVKTAENALRVVRQAVETGEAERLRPVIAEGAVYDSKFSETKYTGADEIIDRLKEIHAAIEKTTYAHPATISRVDSEDLEYGIETRCLILCYGEAESYNSLMFVDVNDDGDIIRIRVDDDSRYHFHLDVLS